MNFKKNLVIILLTTTTICNASMMQNSYQAIPEAENTSNSIQRPEIESQRMDRTTDYAMHIQTTPQHPSTTQYICCNWPQIRDCTDRDERIVNETCRSLISLSLITAGTICIAFGH